MAQEVLMPKLSSTMEVGKITEWFKKEGDTVKVGDPIFEVMTDKIAIEVESYEEGILLKRCVSVDEEAKVNSVVAYIGMLGEILNDDVKEDIESTTIEDKSNLNFVVETKTSIDNASTSSNRMIRATPSARKHARINGIDLLQVKGSGRGGRIHIQDVKDYQVANTPKEISIQQQESKPSTKFVKWDGMRKVIAENMTHSVNTIPHVTMNACVRVNEIMTMRELLNNDIRGNRTRISLTDIITFFVAKTLQEHKILNATTDQLGYTLYDDINVGLAVALENGLVVPVINKVQTMNLINLAEIRKNLVEKARMGKLKPSDMQGGTFTISSIGKGVVKNFTPIINYPQVGILGVGSVYTNARLDSTNTFYNDHMIDLSLSFDHRLVDGQPAAEFLKDLVELIENPYIYFIK